MKKILFQKKIEYLFKEFKKVNIYDEKGLVQLFSKKGIYSNTRKKTVIDKWLNGEMKQAPKNISFTFNQYPISYEYKFSNSESAFSKESFLNNSFSFEAFKREVDKYIAYKNKPITLLEYNYIYYYYRKKKKIVYAKLETEEQIDFNEYRIKITPPISSTGKSIQPYKGTLNINNERYYISVKNDVEILTLYFVLGRGYADNRKVYGIGLGISHQGGLVEATKEIMTKELIENTDEEAKFYLNANESEYLLADEILLEEIYPNQKDIYINKLNSKFNNLTIFIKNSRDSTALKNTINTDPYLNIFYKNFISLNEISKKITQNQSYFIHRRRPVMKSFFRTIANRIDSSCTMVYPVFKNDSILFDSNDDDSKKFLNACSELSIGGLEIHMIFIINNEFEITKYFKKTISDLTNSGIDIKIAFLEELENIKISSYDFIYSKEKDVAVYTSLSDRIRMFKVSTEKEKIYNLDSNYQKIKNISFTLNDIKSKKELIKDEFLEQLIGTWNLYFYSSIKENNKHKIWHNKIEIYRDSSVKYLWNGELQRKGFIDTKFNKEKTIIYLNHLKTEHLTIITLKNRRIHKKIFKVTITDNQVIDDNYDMASFGIFSKEEQNEQLVEDTLGHDMSKLMLCEESNLERKITKIYTESKF